MELLALDHVIHFADGMEGEESQVLPAAGSNAYGELPSSVQPLGEQLKFACSSSSWLISANSSCARALLWRIFS